MKTSPDLFWLAATCMFTALLWMPYVANRFKELGPPGWAWFPQPDPPPRAPWAERAMRAHMNAIENLVVFGPLVVAIHAAGWSSALTAAACQVYFWARVGHFAVCILGLPIVPRTIAFLTGVGAQIVLGWTVLTMAA
ncbi:MAG: MAPEG family protein [Aquisalimonadaceae bacterium]